MNAIALIASEPAIWTETSPGVFQVRLNENATFLVVQEGFARYEVLLPGLGRVKAWNRSQVERLCRDHHENPLPGEEPEDDAEDIGPSPESLRRWHEGRLL